MYVFESFRFELTGRTRQQVHISKAIVEKGRRVASGFPTFWISYTDHKNIGTDSILNRKLYRSISVCQDLVLCVCLSAALHHSTRVSLSQTKKALKL